MRAASLPALARGHRAPHLEHRVQALGQRQGLQPPDLCLGEAPALAHALERLAADGLALLEEHLEEAPASLGRRSLQAMAQVLGQPLAQLPPVLAQALAQVREPQLARALGIELVHPPAQLARQAVVDGALALAKRQSTLEQLRAHLRGQLLELVQATLDARALLGRGGAQALAQPLERALRARGAVQAPEIVSRILRRILYRIPCRRRSGDRAAQSGPEQGDVQEREPGSVSPARPVGAGVAPGLSVGVLVVGVLDQELVHGIEARQPEVEVVVLQELPALDRVVEQLLVVLQVGARALRQIDAACGGAQHRPAPQPQGRGEHGGGAREPAPSRGARARLAPRREPLQDALGQAGRDERRRHLVEQALEVAGIDSLRGGARGGRALAGESAQDPSRESWRSRGRGQALEQAVEAALARQLGPAGRAGTRVLVAREARQGAGGSRQGTLELGAERSARAHATSSSSNGLRRARSDSRARWIIDLTAFSLVPSTSPTSS